MTNLKFKQVVQVSSEDELHKAESLLKGEKWLCDKTPASTEHYVVLELETPSEIHQIELQNESSAFIELQVSNNGRSTNEDDFITLLVPTSFMSPNESKLGTNTNRTKVFTSDKDLDTEIAKSNKWQYIKVLCTQPFGKHQFGIANIALSSEVKDIKGEETAAIKPGLFSLKKESTLDDEDKPLLIASKKVNSEEDQNEKKTIPTPSPKKPNLFERKQPTTAASTSSTASQQHNHHNKENRNQLLRGVIFALSGFQNPLRSELRDLGMKLGAKYRPDWTDDCTHLVCAFANTPKAQQVRQSGGKIVTKEWLEDCEHKQKLLDWKEYELKQNDDDDEEDDVNKPRKAAKNATKMLKKLKQKDEYDESDDEEEHESDLDFVVSDSEIEYEEEEDEDEESPSDESSSDEEDCKKKKKSKTSKKTTAKKKHSSSSSENDEKKSTKKKKKSECEDDDDDLEAYKRKKEKELKKNQNEFVTTKKPFNKKKSDTDENSDMNEDNWQLPTFFDNKQFYLYGDFDDKKRKELRRVIIGFGGDLKDYMSDDIDFVITDREWNKEFEKSLKENSKLIFVTSDWIDACVKKNKMVSNASYQVTKE